MRFRQDAWKITRLAYRDDYRDTIMMIKFVLVSGRGNTSTHTLLCRETLTYERSIEQLCTHQTSIEETCFRSPDSEREIMCCKVVQLAHIFMSHPYYYSRNAKEQCTLTRGTKARSETEFIYETLLYKGW